MLNAKRLGRNPGLILTLASAAVLLACLLVFGAAFQDENSDAILSLPSLWFAGTIVLPVALYLLVGIVWKRLDRIIRW